MNDATYRSDLPDFVEETLLTPNWSGSSSRSHSDGGGGSATPFRCMNFRASFRAAAALRKKSKELEKPPLERRLRARESLLRHLSKEKVFQGVIFGPWRTEMCQKSGRKKELSMWLPIQLGFVRETSTKITQT